VIRRTSALGTALGLVLAFYAGPTGAAERPTASSVPEAARSGPVARVLGFRGARTPTVTRATSPRGAALAHLDRYGALVGVVDPETELVPGDVVHSVTGDDVVHFAQSRGGLPVIGGGVAVDLGADRSLEGISASVSTANVPPATYAAGEALAAALASARKAAPRGIDLRTDPTRHMLYDPAVLGVPRTADPTTAARGVWWVEVHAGPAFDRVLLVDDRSGAVVQSYDMVERLDRTVCDNQNDMTRTDVPCTTGAARTEGGPPSAVADVNHAYDLAGVVSRFYRQIGGIDLTRLIGVQVGDHRTLSSTVRYCDSFLPAGYCPYANAFWNGQAMFYGDGYADADDVVGHEMTHGVIQHGSDLFYWGQSGAINESLADVMGEIIDHRHHVTGESRGSWTIGEDLPHGAIRSLRDPGRFGQPDAMTSKRYEPSGDFDNAGVHINSGVGNRTWYLISQGGRQSGHVVHGIDGHALTKSATLYLAVIQHLVPGSDYADLAATLDHSCRTMARHHTAGMTAGNCRNVHRATLATHLRTTPPKARQAADAPMTCPRGTGPVRVLLDSEKGDPSGRFDAGSTWVRAPDAQVFPPVLANATSGHRSWYSIEPQDVTVSSLAMHPVALPARHPAYVWFQQWRVLDAATRFDGHHDNFDGGTVEVTDATRHTAAKPADRMHWVNGPHDRLSSLYENPAGGRLSFSRDSRGWIASRLALTPYAGHATSPRFTMNTDNNSIRQGWYLDDIRVYSCGRGPMPRTTPTISGTPAVGATLTADPGSWTGHAALRIRWYAGGRAVAGATGTSYQVRPDDVGARITARVIASAGGRHTSTSSAATATVVP
jgi:Zn-dependent metalloprotease